MDNVGNGLGYTDDLYAKLISDGFAKEDIVLVDNGSDKKKPAKNTGLALPWNVRVSGQMAMSLRYLHDYFPQDYYMIVTTSVKLFDNVNYKEVTDKIIADMKNRDIGFVTSSLSGGFSEKFSSQYYDDLVDEYQDTGIFQPMMTIYSHKLIEFSIDNKAGCFNLDLIRGYGMELEMKYLANINGLETLVAKKFHMEWLVNNTHKKGLADENQNSYKNKATQEMERVFIKKYGVNWRVKLMSSKYNKEITNKFRLKNNFIFSLLRIITKKSYIGFNSSTK
ncbi:MAG: hypothetical protein GY793_04730 [Proteobacteria bacterium]|nr:hypothetical protein [Pseudomonadota bacterium]